MFALFYWQPILPVTACLPLYDERRGDATSRSTHHILLHHVALQWELTLEHVNGGDNTNLACLESSLVTYIRSDC